MQMEWKNNSGIWRLVGLPFGVVVKVDRYRPDVWVLQCSDLFGVGTIDLIAKDSDMAREEAVRLVRNRLLAITAALRKEE
jgi:hypothetical protein